LSEKRNSFLILLKNKGFKEERMTKVELDAIDKSTTLESNKSLDAYEQHIRQEYAWVSHAAFLEGRTRILRRFLHRATIYATDHFRQLYEVQARINIARSLRRLEQQV
jgi:predicted metal-dependent HD superfamily phosphohydrolase